MRSHPGGASFFRFRRLSRTFAPQSTNYAPQHQKPATKRKMSQ